MRLIAYLEERELQNSEPVDDLSNNSEMNFYRQLAGEEQFPHLNDEEQVLRIRLQSRRQMNSPLHSNRPGH